MWANRQRGGSVNLHKARNILLLIAILLATAALAACNFSVSTSNISSLKLAKDKDISAETSTFGPHDTIFARGTVSNVSGKVTLKWRLITVKVEGQPDNAPVTNLDKSFDLAGDGESTYDLSAPTAGWPPGQYKIELHMLVESGDEKDQKSAAFTITGE
jgi:hypothetical protein